MSDTEKPRRTRRKQVANTDEPSTTVTASTTDAPTATIEEPSAAARAMMTSILSEDDIYLFNQGTHYRLYDKFWCSAGGAGRCTGHLFCGLGTKCRVCAVIGDWNNWDAGANPLRQRGFSGVWEGFIPHVGKGMRYKFHIASRYYGYREDKTDPFGTYFEVAPQTAAIIWDRDYTWSDQQWMSERGQRQRSMRRSPSTKCIWDRGGANRKRITVRSITVNWPTSWSSM